MPDNTFSLPRVIVIVKLFSKSENLVIEKVPSTWWDISRSYSVAKPIATENDLDKKQNGSQPHSDFLLWWPAQKNKHWESARRYIFIIRYLLDSNSVKNLAPGEMFGSMLDFTEEILGANSVFIVNILDHIFYLFSTFSIAIPTETLTLTARLRSLSMMSCWWVVAWLRRSFNPDVFCSFNILKLLLRQNTAVKVRKYTKQRSVWASLGYQLLCHARKFPHLGWFTVDTHLLTLIFLIWLI